MFLKNNFPFGKMESGSFQTFMVYPWLSALKNNGSAEIVLKKVFEMYNER